MRILLADGGTEKTPDDRSGGFRTLAELLRRAGPGEVEVVFAGTPAEALDRGRSGRVDVALLDLGRPGSTGIETLTCFRATVPWVPVVVFTGEADEERALEAVSLGAQDHVVAGEASGPQLLRTLRLAVERQRRVREEPSAGTRRRSLPDAASGAFLVLELPGFTVTAASGAYLEATRITLEEIRGRGLLEVFPEDPADGDRDGARSLRRSLEWVVRHGEPHTMPARRYPVPVRNPGGGGFEERWLSPVNAPVFDEKGQVRFVVHRLEDVTEFVGKRSGAGAGQDKVLHDDTPDRMEEGTPFTLEVRAHGALRDLTPTREAEATVERETRRFRELAEAMPLVVWTADSAGGVDFFSTDLLRYTGLEAQALLGDGWAQVVHPDDSPRVAEAWTRSAATGDPYEVDFRIRRHDGTYRWHLVQAVAAREGPGEVTRWYGSAVDVEDRLQVEAEAARLGERLTATLESITDAFYTLDREWCFTFVNASAERVLGRSRTELLGKVVWEAFPYTVGSTFETEYRRAMADRTSAHFEAWYPPPLDGWFEVRAYPSDEGLAVYFQNVTERRARDARIREQAELLDHAQDAILVRGMDHRIRYANAGAERLYGWSREELVGKRADELLFRDPEEFHEATGRVLSEVEWTGELQQTRRDGSPIWVEGRWSLIRSDAGEPTGILAVNTDLTERKKLQAQVLRAQRLESIGTLAGGIAHDLNNVLAPILLSIGLLRDEVGGEGAREILDTIEASAERGADMVRQVLSFSRGLEGSRMPVDVGKVARDLARVARDTFPKNITVESRMDEGLWRIPGDSTQIHQVLMNLAVNARDAMPDGGAIRFAVENVTIGAEHAMHGDRARPGPWVRVTVSDDGVGMSPELQARIFDPFFTTKEVGKGTGLGLSTVDAIVRSHGGFLSVYSDEGSGATFRIYLPAHPEAGNPEAVPPPAPRELPRGKGELILVVDDEASVRTITRQTLEAFGYRILTATDGADAVAIYGRHGHEIDAVVTDISMPIMDGPSLIRALRRMDPDVRIIAASGQGTSGAVVRGAGSGVRDFLPKPYTAETLLETVRRVLEEGA